MRKRLLLAKQKGGEMMCDLMGAGIIYAGLICLSNAQAPWSKA